MGAVATTALALLSSGDRVVVERRVYGGTLRLFRDLAPRLGIDVRWLEGDDDQALTRALAGGAKALFLESPTNPVLDVLDVAKVAKAARAAGAVSVLDGTFATPVRMRGLELGCDLVLHSATKGLGGHHDLLAGVVSGKKELIARIASVRRLTGAILDPHAAYLLSRGLKTLALRTARQDATALALARALEGTKGVKRVRYPGLDSHPRAALAKAQMKSPGSMMAIELEGGVARTRAVAAKLEVATLAPSLGGTETLVSLPVTTSHVGLSSEELARAGIDPATLRISVGLEAPEDLIADFTRAIESTR
jgi:cystathionine beta-lyase/cystathionine gamma-synthase